MSVDLKNMSRKQLEKLATQVEKALKSLDNKGKREAKKAAEKAAAKYGFSLAELAAAPAGKKRGPKPGAKSKKAGKAKYKNPSDAKQTWTGKGRQPAWFKAAIESGKSAEDMAV